MDRYEICAAVASVAALANTALYVCTIVWGPTRPPRSSYWIWTALGFLLLSTYVGSGGANWYLNAANSAGTGLVAFLSIKYGDGAELTWWDRLAIKIALGSIPLWVVLRFFLASEHAALGAFAVQMVADAAAGMPMLEKCWNRPHLESRAPWVFGTSVYAVNAFAVREWTPQDIVWNGWLGGVCLVVTLMLFLRPRPAASALET